MEDKRKESQKTVVAFVAGLLIGGLLVWVFSAAPEATSPDISESDDTNTSSEDLDTVVDENTTPSTANENIFTNEQVTSDISFEVSNQSAGDVVSLGDDVLYPTVTGWIVVHEEVGGELGNALGAVRFDTQVGLAPTTVTLLRSTEAGQTYHVVYYADNGDDMFSIRDDATLMTEAGTMVQATFVAE